MKSLQSHFNIPPNTLCSNFVIGITIGMFVHNIPIFKQNADAKTLLGKAFKKT